MVSQCFTIDLGGCSQARGRLGRCVASLVLMPTVESHCSRVGAGVHPSHSVDHLKINELAMVRGAEKKQEGEVAKGNGAEHFGDAAQPLPPSRADRTASEERERGLARHAGLLMNA